MRLRSRSAPLVALAVLVDFVGFALAGCDPGLVHGLPAPLPPNDDGRCPDELTPTAFVVKPELDRVTCTFAPAGDGFRTVIERSRGGEGFLQIGEVDGSSTTFDDLAADPDEDYEYRALAKSNACESAPTPPIAVTTRGRAPAATALVESTATSLRVTFTDTNLRETGYVARAVAAGDTAPAAEVSVDALADGVGELLLEGLVPDTAYDVTVASTGPFGDGAPATLPATTLALAPTAVSAAVNGLTLSVAWSSDADDATAFVIDVVDAATSASLQSVSVGATERQAEVALPADGTTLRVEVRAENAGGRSAPGTSADVTVPCLTGVGPSDLVVTSEPLGAAGGDTAVLHVAFTSVAPPSYRFDATATPAGGPAASGSATGGARVVDVTVPRDTSFAITLSHVGATGCTDGAAAVGAAVSVPFDVTSLASESRPEGVLLSWQETSATETGVVVRRTRLADAAVLETTRPPDTTGHLDANAARDDTYTYEVIAAGPNGNAAAAVVEVDTLPTEPVNVNVVNEGNALRVSWNNTSATATEVRIDRAVLGSSDFATLATLAPNAITFLDTPPDFASYTYRVVVVNRGGSVFTEASGSRACDAALAVDDFAASVLDNDDVRFTFTPASPDMAVTVQRAVPGGTFADVGTSAAGATFVDDAQPPRDSVFEYRAVGRAGVCTTPFTAVLEVITAPNVSTLSARRDNADPTRVELGWSDVSAHEIGLRVERQTPAGSGGFVAVGPDLAPGSTSFVDATALPGEQSAWRVVVIGRDASRATSPVVLRVAPQPPTLVTAEGGPNSIVLTWQAPATGVVDGYELLRDGLLVASAGGLQTTGSMGVGDDDGHEVSVRAVAGGVRSLSSSPLRAHRHLAPVMSFSPGVVAPGQGCEATLSGTVTFDGSATAASASADSVPGFQVRDASATGVTGNVILTDEEALFDLTWFVSDSLGFGASTTGRWRLLTDEQALVSAFAPFPDRLFGHVAGQDLGVGRQPLTDVNVVGPCGGCVGRRASIAMTGQRFGKATTLVLGDDGQPFAAGDVGFQSAPTPRPLCDNGSLADGGSCNLGSKLADVVAVSTNQELVCVLFAGGSLVCEGNGSFSDNNVAQVVLGAQHHCLLTNNGTVRCTGSNVVGQLGNNGGFGDVCGDFCPSPLSDVVHLASGANHSCAVNNQGLFCWGENAQGQLGTAFGSESAHAIEVFVGGQVTALAAGGNATCAVVDGTQVQCFGEDFGGSPERQPFSVQPVAVAVDRCVCALGDRGEVECVGSTFGLSCEGRHPPGSLQICVDDACTATIDDAVAVASAGDSSCALSASRGLLCWGDNSSAQLGDGTFTDHDVARPMCASGSGPGCPSFDRAAYRSCGNVSLDPLPFP